MARDYEEKRDFIRMALECPVNFSVQGETTNHEAVVRDLSGSGLCIISPREVGMGSLLRVRVMPATAAIPPLEAEVEVVRVQPGGGSSYELGVAIRKILG